MDFRGAGALRLILSSESFLFAWNSGCLNSHAWPQVSLNVKDEREVGTDIGPIWRWTAILVVLSDLVEVIFIQLSDETRKVAVLEVFREDQLGEFFVLPLASDLLAVQTAGPEWRTSKTTKLSPPSPQRTMLSYDGSSNIL